MATDRGRPLYPTGGPYLGLPPKGRSPHISPDRITRHASPGRYGSQTEAVAVVSRIPQPYKTSFSAVTSPCRISRSAEAEHKDTLSRSEKVSSPCQSESVDQTSKELYEAVQQITSPEVHISPPSSSQSSSRSSKKSEFEGASSSRGNASKGSTDTKDYLKPAPRLSLGEPRSTQSHLMEEATRRKSDSYYGSSTRHTSPKPSTSGFVAEKVSKSGKLKKDKKKSSDSYVDNYPEITEETVDSVFTDNAPHVSITEGDAEVQEFMRTPSPHHHFVHDEPSSPVKSSGFHSTDTVLSIESEAKKKKVIEKEYVHVTIINYNDAKNVELKIKPDSETEDIVQDMMGIRGSAGTVVKRPLAKRDSSRSKASSAPSTPKASRREQGRPTPAFDNGSSPKVKKSLSASITNFFKKMSPKQLRKTSRLEHSSHSSTPRSSTGSLQASDADPESLERDSSGPRRSGRFRSKSPKSPIHSLFSHSDKHKVSAQTKSQEIMGTVESKENIPLDQGQQQQPKLSGSAARILKSIEDNSSQSQEKSMYKAFKERQSPRHSPEAVGMKSQALRVVEISDDSIYAGPEVLISTQGGSSDQLAGSSDIGLHSTLKRTGSGTKGKPPPGRQKKSLDPPRSLPVREVAHLTKGTGFLSTVSTESIGQCSLDVYAGSVGSLNNGSGRQSAMTVSKRTITSQDNIVGVSHQMGSEDLPDPKPLKQGDIADPSMETQSVPSKLPSYLKLSCAVSGYNKYSTYTPDRDSRTVKVSKVSRQKRDTLEQKKPHMQNGVSHDNNNESCDVPGIAVIDKQPGSAGLVGPHIDNRTSTDREHSVLEITNGAGPSHDQTDSSVVRTYSEDRPGSKQGPCNGVSTCTDDVATPNKDGKYFLAQADQEQEKIEKMCSQAEEDLTQDLSEEAHGKLRAAIGKAHLLVGKKFKQFRGLCEKNLTQSSDDPFQTTCEDLAGFWDMVYIQIQDVTAMFDEIDAYRKNGWQSPQRKKTKPKAVGSAGSRTSRGKVTKPALSAGRTEKAKEAAKAREEARKRLMAAKRAGRERKASQSDKEEIEIYVP